MISENDQTPESIQTTMIRRMILRLDPYQENDYVVNVRKLIDDGVPHGKFNFSEIREYYNLSNLKTFITTKDNRFYLNEESGELFILLELL